MIYSIYSNYIPNKILYSLRVSFAPDLYLLQLLLFPLGSHYSSYNLFMHSFFFFITVRSFFNAVYSAFKYPDLFIVFYTPVFTVQSPRHTTYSIYKPCWHLFKALILFTPYLYTPLRQYIYAYVKCCVP